MLYMGTRVCCGAALGQGILESPSSHSREILESPVQVQLRSKALECLLRRARVKGNAFYREPPL